jgi:transcriptional regulator
MYLPGHFTETRVPVLHSLMRRHPLAALVTMTGGGLVANHLPLLLDAAPEPLGCLRGHFARSNPQWREFLPDMEALAIFQGPEHYITPSWYAAKKTNGRVVPTWNYIAVHAYGRLQLFDGAAQLRAFLEALTASQEDRFERPWRMEDAPAEYIGAQIAAIVGFELRITRIEGKWKLNQNRPAEDRAGVIAALEEEGSPLAALMKKRV